MCGRYTLDVTSADLGRMLEGDMSVEWNPSWNIKPTQHVPAFYETITDDGEITRTGLMQGEVTIQVSRCECR